MSKRVIECYEKLRWDVLHPEEKFSTTQGHSLFMRQGMLNWAEAVVAVEPPHPETTNYTKVEGALILEKYRRELIHGLATIISSCMD